MKDLLASYRDFLDDLSKKIAGTYQRSDIVIGIIWLFLNVLKMK
jgi:hypothetical protein